MSTRTSLQTRRITMSAVLAAAGIPGEFPFVNHGFGHGQKGAIGFLVVEP